MFLLLAELNANPSTATEVASLLQELATAVQREPGNLVYAVHRPVETPATFVVYELYKDRAACDAHLASVPVRQALAQFDTLLAVPPRIMFCDTIASKGLASTVA